MLPTLLIYIVIIFIIHGVVTHTEDDQPPLNGKDDPNLKPHEDEHGDIFDP